MEKIIHNDSNVLESEVTEVVKRVKLLLVNSNKELMLGYSHHDYQFPGGHVEDDEELISTINREIQEETGIELNVESAEPFAAVYGYYRDWPEQGKTRKIEIYYYEIKTDLKPVLENTNYTASEKEGGFELRYIPLNEVEKELTRNAEEYGDVHGITKEMLQIIEVYKTR